MKRLLLPIAILCCSICSAQYLAVKARYTETRLVDNPGHAPTRENRLVLTFFFVGTSMVYTPANLVNHQLWIQKEGLHYAGLIGGIYDSTGNNYPNYPWTAPHVVSHYNSYGPNHIECDPNVPTQFIVNGSELDCGFVRVSYWEGDGTTENEMFPAPNILLPYYTIAPFPDYPGNLNFYWPVAPGPPYNWYSFQCGGIQHETVRGILAEDTACGGPGTRINCGGDPLPVRFAFVRGALLGETATISWSNLTETNIAGYSIERSVQPNEWQVIGTVTPTLNDGTRADYDFQTLQSEESVFYRIMATELDGGFLFSQVIVLKRNAPTNEPEENNSILTVYPNPVTGNQFAFRLTNADKGRYISFIVTPDGKQVKQKMIEHEGGDLRKEILLDGILPGIYKLVIRGANRRYSKTILINY